LITLYKKKVPLYLITDTKIAGLSHVQIARRAMDAGIRTIQLREKDLSKKIIFKEALRIRELTNRVRATFIINDYIDVALTVNADGIHLGQDDMPLKEARGIMGKGKIIGISTHSLNQAIKAQEGGADYIGFGPMYHTTTKDAGRPKGVRALRTVRKNIHIPIVAIGGITWENVNKVLDAGADAAAVGSGILSGRIKVNVKKFMEAISQEADTIT
jgi:thiamine-phosphate pyrophosphorylase